MAAVRPYSACILCAKQEELRQTIEVVKRRYQRQRANHLGETVYSLGNDETLLVATCNDVGHLTAAVRTAQIVQIHHPRTIIFVGTAASLKPERVQIGDVVIPKVAFSRYYDKVSEKGQADYEARVLGADFREFLFDKENALIADLRTVSVSSEAQAMIARLDLQRIRLEAGTEGDVEIGGTRLSLRRPKLHDDVDIVSCGMVVDSVSYREFLTRVSLGHARKAEVIDMESYGFFKVLDALRHSGVGHSTEGIMIRGISDYAGRKQQTEQLPAGWKESSVRNAAHAAVDLIAELFQ